MSLRSADLDILQLRQLRPAFRSPTDTATKTLIQAFVSCCLDYCNSLLYDVSYGIMIHEEAWVDPEHRRTAHHRRQTM